MHFQVNLSNFRHQKITTGLKYS